MRLLFAARLSQLQDGQTGLDTQESEAARWAEHNGHTVVGIASDWKTGRSHLWERPNLRPWVTEPEYLAQYDGILCLKVDRLTRADDEGVDQLKAWARQNHKEIWISSGEVHFPSEGMDGARWDMYIRMAHKEWLDIKERYGRMQDAKHEAGSLIGRPPWGYEIVKAGDIKILEPTPEARLWAPRIFNWIGRGMTCPWVAEELEIHGVKPRSGGKWNEASINKIIHNTVYTGIRKRDGRAGLKVEPVVSHAQQDKALKMLAQRAIVGRDSVVMPKALLAKLKCGHPGCPGEGTWPMYRYHAGFYRCCGRGPQRHGCGHPMVDLVTLDNLVLNFTEYWDTKEHLTQEYKSGNEAGVLLDQLRAEMADVMKVTPAALIGQVAADYAVRIAELESEGVQPHWEDVPTGMTEGQYLRSLDLDGQRHYLARKSIKAWKDPQGRICVTVDGATARTGGSVFGDPEAG